MELVIILLVVWLISASLIGLPPKKASLQTVVDVQKTCPPHKWRYQDIRDREGNLVRWTIVCDVCGPIKPMDGPARLE